MNQHEYVKAVYQYYRENDIIPGDPNEGPWEEAHYPLPQPEGDEWIYLKPEHHFIQGILQSEDVGRCCFHTGVTRIFLREFFFKKLPYDFQLQLTSLFAKWSLAQIKNGHETNRKNGTGAWDPNVQSKAGKIGGKIGGAKTAKLGIGIHNFDSRSKGGKKGGRTTAESGALRIASSAGGKVSGSAQAKRLNAQKWRCLVTGHISNPGALSVFQRARGIDRSLRERVHQEPLQT